MEDARDIRFCQWRCANCEGYQSREVTAYINGSGWCRGCVRRLEHWWAWLIPAPPNNPLAFLLWCYAAGPLIILAGFLTGNLIWGG